MTKRSSAAITAIAIIYSVSVFAFDVALPLGVAGGVPYIVVVLLGIWVPGLRFVLGFALTGTVLTIFGYFISPTGGLDWMVLTNRALALFAIWASALLVIQSKRHDKTLKLNDARFRDFAESSSDWFWEMDADLRFTYLTASIDENLDRPATLSMGRTRKDVFAEVIESGTPEEQENWRRHFADLEARRPFKNFVQQWITPAGEHRIFVNSGKPIFDDAGKFAGYRGTASNVTEAVLAERALQGSESRYRALVESGTVGMLVFDLDYWPIYVSKLAAEIFGYDSAAEMEALPSFGEILPEKEEKRIAERRRRRFAGEDVPPIYEVEGRHKDGSTVWILQHAAVIEWEGGQAMLSTITDITRQKENEAEAARQSAVVTALIDTLPAHISLRDRDGKFIFVNQTMAQDYERDTSEFVGHRLDEIGRPVDGPSLQSMAEEVLQSGEPIRNFVFDPPRFPDRTFLTNILPLPQADGVLAISQDITEHVNAEEALRNNEQQLRLIANAMPGLIAYIDSSLRYQFINELGERWYARPSAEIIGRKVVEVLGEVAQRARRDLFSGVLAGIPQFFEVSYAYPDGQTRLVSGHYVPHKNENGKIIGFYALMMDITERHMLEERLRQAQKMEAVGQLTGGIAHDFNNLLAIILGNAELLSSSSERSQAAPQAIVRAAERGAELTRNLLAFSRKQPLSPRIVDPAALVAGMSDMMQRSLGETIRITTSSDPDLWPAMADPGQLENALLNLALNARDAMPAGGELTVGCRNIELRDVDILDEMEVVAGNYVMLAVSDTGAGMNAETQQHAFEPFYTTKGVGEGSGLGLSMVYGFAKQSGGHVDISSEQGLGTTVRLYLPRATHQTAAVEPETRNASPLGRGEAVLVIEDDAEVRELTVAMLESMDYRVTEAADAAAARQVMEDGTKIDVVLSDVILPGGTSGPEFARELRRREPDLKVIFMSGYPDDTANGGDLLDTGSILLAKPFYLRQLATAMRQALG